jgi:hypothetical protein
VKVLIVEPLVVSLEAGNREFPTYVRVMTLEKHTCNEGAKTASLALRPRT